MNTEKFLNGARTHELWTKIKAALSGKQDLLIPDETVLIKDGGISVKTPVKPLTQAEYDGLSEEEKQAEAVYLVDEPPWLPVPLSIQEYDTEDGWHVRKWSDGYVEMIYKKSHTGTSLAYGGESLLFFDSLNTDFQYPFALKEKFSETFNLLSCSNSGNLKHPIMYSIGGLTKTNSWGLLIGSNPIQISADISIVVTGTWK